MTEVTIIGLDLAKNVFQVHGMHADGSVGFRIKLVRSKVLSFFSKQPACVNGGVKSVHWGGVKVVHFALAVSLSMESTGGPRARRAAALSCASGAARVGGACGPPWSSG